MTETIINTEPYRLARYYLEKLDYICRLYRQGGDHIDDALILINLDWAQIHHWYQWSTEETKNSSDAAWLCSKFVSIGEIILDLILPLKEQLVWQQQALDAARQLGGKSDELTHVVALAQIYERLDNYPKSWEFATEAFNLSQLLDDKHNLAQTITLMGTLSMHMGRYEDASAYFDQCLRICEVLKEEDIIASNQIGLGQLANLRANFANARTHFETACLYYRQLDNQRELARAIKYLADSVFFQGEYDLAIQYYEKALRIFNRIGDDRGVADVMMGMAIHTLGEPGVNTARQHAIHSLQINRQLESQRGIAESLRNLAIIESLNFNYETGREFAYESMQIYRQLGSIYHIVDLMLVMIYANLELKEIAASHHTLMEALYLNRDLETEFFVPQLLAASSYHFLLTGELEYGVVLCGLASVSPNLRAHVRDFALPTLLERFARLMDPKILEAALVNGKSGDSHDILEKLIKEFQNYS